MKFDHRNSLAARTMAFSAAIMDVFYLFEGFYFLCLGLQKSLWQVLLLGAILFLYGSFQLYRNYQKYRNEGAGKFALPAFNQAGIRSIKTNIINTSADRLF